MIAIFLDNEFSRTKLVLTKYLLFSLRDTFTIPPIKIGSNEISRSEFIKFLGVHLDQHLKFDQHVAYLSQKISKSVGILYKLKFFIPNSAMITLYHALIQPYILYAIESWFGCSSYLRNRIIILQKKSIRCVFNLNYNDHTSSYFDSARIMTVSQLYELSVLLHIHKTINGNFDNIMSSRLRPLSDAHDFPTRSSQNLIIPMHRSSKFEKSILYTGIKLWNELSLDLRSIESYYAFKSRVKNTLLA